MLFPNAIAMLYEGRKMLLKVKHSKLEEQGPYFKLSMADMVEKLV